MDTGAFLLAANAAVWLGIGGYVAFLARAQKQLEQRLRQMELLRHEHE